MNNLHTSKSLEAVCHQCNKKEKKIVQFYVHYVRCSSGKIRQKQITNTERPS